MAKKKPPKKAPKKKKPAPPPEPAGFVRISFTCPAEYKLYAARAAKLEDRSFSSIMRKAIEALAEKREETI